MARPFLARGKCRYHPNLYQAAKRGCIIAGPDRVPLIVGRAKGDEIAVLAALRFDSPDDVISAEWLLGR
jgi:hypothetical protein